ncbi:hypothetical protein LCGC14_0836610 [marine sediment metagenome]|uniref:Uncharacterized protein n=1 Tax=marine sediment metagenome TaxID=412755 RepID=A0A0F9PJ01_9ZZZZ
MPPKPSLSKLFPNPVGPLRKILREGREQLSKAEGDIRSVAEELQSLGGARLLAGLTAPVVEKEAPPEQNEISTSPGSISKGTACLPCSRDHLSVTSSALSEGIRFARDKGVKDHEVMRRVRIALDELNIMERIDLAPEEIAKLKGAEKDLADWTLKQSRDLRHAITAIKDVETMEQAAARASEITEEFMSRLWAVPAEECVTCGEVRERLREFIERRKRQTMSS